MSTVVEKPSKSRSCAGCGKLLKEWQLSVVRGRAGLRPSLNYPPSERLSLPSLSFRKAYQTDFGYDQREVLN